ncbi:hypothetical protein [Streptomyces tritici]|uniref:hypothetical protein n=1 Tax=Streptomyces tritici TaxID=2054410 RepID=UPI003AF019A5
MTKGESDAMADENGGTQEKPAAKPGTGIALWMPVGLCLGISLGQLSDNLGLGIALGISVGSAVGVAFETAAKKRREEAPGTDA